MKQKIIVTGGAGYIGSHVIKQLLDSNLDYELHVIDNFSQTRKNIMKHGSLSYHEIDICDKENLLKVFKQIKPDVVMHFAALASVPDSVKNPSSYFSTNVTGSINLLEAMREVDCKKIIFSSSASVYGEPLSEIIDEDHPKNPTNPYGYTKLVVEKILESYNVAYGFSSISFRYFCATGNEPSYQIGEYHDPETHVIPSLVETYLGKRDKFYVFGNDFDTPDGTGIRDYIHVDDLASAHIKALVKVGEEICCKQYNLGINQGFSVKELISTLEKLTGEKVPYEIKERRPGDPSRLIANSSKAKTELLWTPVHTNIEKLVETTLQSFKARG
jgi:UDP-glucose-4-epimerase GalE